MNNNDVLRSLRYAMDISETTIVQIMKLAGDSPEKAAVIAMMKKEEEDGFVLCDNVVLNTFLDGLIIKLRGKREGSEQTAYQPDSMLSNNSVLKKIRIAYELKEEDIHAIMDLAGFRVSKPEVSALFRKEGHKNYRSCGDQFLRNFLKGLALRLRASQS